MKHSHRTKLTALMFSAAAITAGMLSVSCSGNEYNVYGPPSGWKSDGAAAETPAGLSEGGVNGMDQDAIRDLTDADLIGFGKNFDSFGTPPFLTARPVSDSSTIVTAEKSAADDAAAEQLAAGLFPGATLRNITDADRKGIWHLFEAGEGQYALVWDTAFLDMETMTLKAGVSSDNLLLIASVTDMPDGRKLGAFIEDEYDQLRVKLYDLVYEKSEDGAGDLIHIYGRDFTADKSDGKLKDFNSDLYFLHQKERMPGAG